jgi:hypothetical protein
MALLGTTPPREHSGSQTAARYDFQANFAILKLLELHAIGNDYCLVFDWHDDVVAMDSPTAPTKLYLYQVKSRDGAPWTVGDLSKHVGAKKPRSIASRLYAHVETFNSAAIETAFVSNAAYKIGLLTGSESTSNHVRICGDELNLPIQSQLINAVKADYASGSPESWLPRLVLIRTPLGIAGQKPFVVGQLQLLIEEVLGGSDYRIGAMYDTLHSAIVQRTKYSAVGESIDVVLPNKSLSKVEFENFLQKATKSSRSLIREWSIIEPELHAAGLGSMEQIRLKTAVTKMREDVAKNSPAAAKIHSNIQAWLSANQVAVEAQASVLALAQLVRSKLADSCGYDDRALLAAALLAAYELASE